MQTAGLSLPLNQRLVFDATFERGAVTASGTPLSGSPDLDRTAGTASASYGGDRLRAQARVEVRSDQPNGGPSQLSWLASGMATLHPHKDLTLRVKAFFAKSTAPGATLGHSSEASFGFAYRPSFTDRLALIGRYSFVDEGLTGAQADGAAKDPATGLPMLARERAHVASIAGEGRLFWRLSLAEKVGMKLRQEPDLGTSAMMVLWVNRLSLHVTRAWDAVAEYRLLSVPGTSLAHGVAIEVNRIIVGHLRLGAGWNFADFSDEELQLGRGSQRGFFIRAQGFY
jgi:hypothetical protein